MTTPTTPTRVDGTLDPLFAVRVLTYQGRIEYADADLVPHLREIYDRYEELKGVNDFATAGLTARSEWLARYMKANREL